MKWGQMRFEMNAGGTKARASLSFSREKGWRFAVSGNSGASGFGWVAGITNPGRDLTARLEATFFHGMPPAVLADALEEEGYPTIAAWLRNPDLKPVELVYS